MAWGKGKTININEDEESNEDNKSFSDYFKPSIDFPDQPSINIILWGNEKVGKTHFTSTAPKPHFVIDTESIYEKFLKYNVKDREDIYIIDCLRLSEVDNGKVDVLKSLDILFKGIDKLVTHIKDNSITDGTIIVDSISDVYDWLNIWTESNASKTLSDGKPNRLEYGKRNRLHAQLIHLLKFTNLHVIFTARAIDEVSNVGANLGTQKPKMHAETKYVYDLIAKISRVNDEHVFRITGGSFGDYIIGKELINPTWDDLMKFINDNLGFKITKGND